MDESLTEALATAAAGIEVCWRAGSLRYKLLDDLTQLALYEEIKACPSGEYVTEGARKLGKSYLHGVIVLELALTNPGKQVNWLTATKMACRGTLLPILQEISDDAPPECMGRYDGENSRWLLPNGAFVKLVGAETRQDVENSRGPSSIATVADEAGFIALLEYALDGVFGPQMRRVRRVPGTFVGMTLLVSTTPYAPSHYFCKRADMAAVMGHYRKLTIYNSGWETLEQIEAYIASEAAKKGLTVDAFKATSTFRREYLSERVIDEENVVFPEFHREREHVVREHVRPPGFARYVQKRVSVDPGMSDKTGFLVGYVDFANQLGVIEAESLLSRPNTETIAKESRRLELETWGEVEDRTVSRVIDDTHGRMVLDLWDLQHIRFNQAVKNDRDASIGLARTRLQQHRIIISPKCVQLQKQLLEAVKDGSKKDFARNDDGHFDLAAAFMYWGRGLDFTTNPYPAEFDARSGAERPSLHPLVARREALGRGAQTRGLAAQLLASNRWTQAGWKRRP